MSSSHLSSRVHCAVVAGAGAGDDFCSCMSARRGGAATGLPRPNRPHSTTAALRHTLRSGQGVMDFPGLAGNKISHLRDKGDQAIVQMALCCHEQV